MWAERLFDFPSAWQLCGNSLIQPQALKLVPVCNVTGGWRRTAPAPIEHKGENEDGKKASTLQTFCIRVGNPGLHRVRLIQHKVLFFFFPFVVQNDIHTLNNDVFLHKSKHKSVFLSMWKQKKFLQDVSELCVGLIYYHHSFSKKIPALEIQTTDWWSGCNYAVWSPLPACPSSGSALRQDFNSLEKQSGKFTENFSWSPFGGWGEIYPQVLQEVLRQTGSAVALEMIMKVITWTEVWIGGGCHAPTADSSRLQSSWKVPVWHCCFS